MKFSLAKLPSRDRQEKIDDWSLLVKGDRIKSIKKNGPYYKTRDGKKIYMGNYGELEVVSVNEQGINTNRGFVYMGTSQFNKETGVYREPHKIKKLRRKV